MTTTAMKQLLTYVLCICIILLPAAACMSPERQQDNYARLNEDFRAGRISQEQYEELLQASRGSSAVGWAELVGGVVASVAGAYGAVQLRRGPPATKDERVARKTATR